MAIRGAVALGRELPTPPPDAPGHPFSLADPDRVRSILGAAGYDAVELDPVDEPMVAGSDADDAFAFLGSSNLVGWLLEGVDDAGRAQADRQPADRVQGGRDGRRRAARHGGVVDQRDQALSRSGHPPGQALQRPRPARRASSAAAASSAAWAVFGAIDSGRPNPPLTMSRFTKRSSSVRQR